jgi:hypothetical protein
MPGVDSTAVDRVDYTVEIHRLDVRFADGGSCSFFGVPIEVYQALLAAPSIDAFVKLQIIDRFPSEGA